MDLILQLLLLSAALLSMTHEIEEVATVGMQWWYTVEPFVLAVVQSCTLVSVLHDFPTTDRQTQGLHIHWQLLHTLPQACHHC